MEKKGMTATEAEIQSEAERMREKGVPPSIAVTKVFTDMYYKRKHAEEKFPKLLNEVCHSFGLEYADAADKDLSDIRSIACYIAVERYDLRPHSVIREYLGLSSNSMVNHSLYRATKQMDKSVIFAEKLNEVLSNLGLKTIG